MQNDWILWVKDTYIFFTMSESAANKKKYGVSIYKVQNWLLKYWDHLQSNPSSLWEVPLPEKIPLRIQSSYRALFTLGSSGHRRAHKECIHLVGVRTSFCRICFFLTWWGFFSQRAILSASVFSSWRETGSIDRRSQGKERLSLNTEWPYFPDLRTWKLLHSSLRFLCVSAHSGDLT